MKRRILNIEDVAAWQLCCGCGVCAYVSPDEIEMIDTLDHGRRPRFKNGAARDSRSSEAMRVCPGLGLEHDFDRREPTLIRELTPAWGPVRGVWEGYACDPEIRFMGSSGGVATALALYCIEKAGMYGVLHVAARPDVPYLNHTVLSTTRQGLIAGAGSRYAPASPCDGLQKVEDAPAPCVFIGKPCDVAALQKARKLRPALDAKVGLTIAFFCAGVPSTRATLELLEHFGVDDPARITGLRYRGQGWPGRFTVCFTNAGGREEVLSLSYEESWGFLARCKQWRCNLCPDHTGEFADIAVGDPWYRKVRDGEPGSSLIVARTIRGRDFLLVAARDGYMVLEKSDPTLLPASQPNQIDARAAVWGRLFGLRLARVPVPQFAAFALFRLWLHRVRFWAKLRGILGSIARVRRRGLRRRQPIVAFEPAVAGRKHVPHSVGVAAR